MRTSAEQRLIKAAFAAEQRSTDPTRHKCFLSYHANDANEVAAFVEAFGEAFIPRVIGVLKGVQIAVLDTHVLLHFQLFAEVPWQKVLGLDSLRVAVPLRVIDELDRLKASRRSDIASRAGVVIKHLQRRVSALTDRSRSASRWRNPGNRSRPGDR
jgi:hypothetical protein